MERGGSGGRGVRLDESLRAEDIQQDCKFYLHTSGAARLSLVKRSVLLLITQVDVIISINNV